MLFVEAKQNLDELLMFDPHVKFAKSIGVKNIKIRHALMEQLKKDDRNFENRQELLNAILDLNEEDKCMKCKSNKKNAVGMPWQDTHTLLLVMFTKIDRKNPRVQSLRETFFLFYGYKNVRSHESIQHGNLHQPSRQTSPSSKRNQASCRYPPYTSCYETIMEQKQLLSQAKEMKNAARDPSHLKKSLHPD